PSCPLVIIDGLRPVLAGRLAGQPGDRFSARSSGVCSRTMVRAVPLGIREGVANETITVTRNAMGTVQAAGWASSAPTHPPCTPPATVTRTADMTSRPPVTNPVAAPAVDRPRHQTPSTSRGQNVDAATAKARPTVSASPTPTESGETAYGTRTAPPAAPWSTGTATESPPVRALIHGCRRSWLRTPATEMVNPDAVERKAAKAPPASRADSSSPSTPGLIAVGSISTTESALTPWGRLGR